MIERCNGAYEKPEHGLGVSIRRECIGCQRRVAQGEPMPVPEFTISCPKKVSEE